MNPDSYSSPPWLPGGHLQTLYPTLFLHGPQVDYRRERWELDDGDFLDVDWLDGPADAPLVVLFHGLEGSSDRPYARSLMQALQQHGWGGAAVNFRGCSGEPNRLPRAYFAGDSAEIETVLARIRGKLPAAPVHAVGISLGGNALLKWLGEAGEAARQLISSAVAVSAPLDMNAAGAALDSGFNRQVYTRYFLSTLKAKSLAKAARFPGLMDAEAIRAATTFREFDTLVTAKLHGYRDAEDYWTRTSSKSLLRHIAVPTLVLNAKNDPFLPAHVLPQAHEVSPSVSLLQPGSGGHVRFPAGPFPGHINWLPQRILAFLNQPAK
jgi:predicted alpha/beta-fold hydrolase